MTDVLPTLKSSTSTYTNDIQYLEKVSCLLSVFMTCAISGRVSVERAEGGKEWSRECSKVSRRSRGPLRVDVVEGGRLSSSTGCWASCGADFGELRGVGVPECEPSILLSLLLPSQPSASRYSGKTQHYLFNGRENHKH